MIDVVAGVIRCSQGRVLIALRPKHADQGGLWEFPGGKREKNESRFQALSRELAEELGIEVRHAVPLFQLQHHYPGKTVHLDVWDVERWAGSAIGREGQSIRWVEAAALDDFKFPAANAGILKAARLPRVAVGFFERSQVSPLDRKNQLEECLRRGIRLFLVDAEVVENAACDFFELRELCAADEARLVSCAHLTAENTRSPRIPTAMHCALEHLKRLPAALEFGVLRESIGSNFATSDTSTMTGAVPLPLFVYSNGADISVSSAINQGFQGVCISATAFLDRGHTMDHYERLVSAAGESVAQHRKI